MVQKYDIPVELIHIEVTETVGDMDHVLIEMLQTASKNSDSDCQWMISEVIIPILRY